MVLATMVLQVFSYVSSSEKRIPDRVTATTLINLLFPNVLTDLILKIKLSVNR